MIMIGIRKCFILIAISLFAFAVQAQDLYPETNDKGKFGYVDKDGNLVIPFKYTEASPFENGLARVKNGSKFGFINEKGEPVGKIKYSYAMYFNGDFCRVAVGGKFKDGLFTDGKWGFIDRQGNEILPVEYDEIGNFENGFAYIMKKELYGLINEQCNIVLEPSYASVGKFDKNGLCWFALAGKNSAGYKYGLINSDGKIILQPEYFTLGYFYDIENNGENIEVEVSSSSSNLNKYSLGKLFRPLYNEECFINMMLENVREPAEIDSISELYKNVKVSSSDKYVYAVNMKGEYSLYDTDGNVVIEAGLFNGSYLPSDNIVLAYTGSDENKHFKYYNLLTKQTFDFGAEKELSSFSCGLGRVQSLSDNTVFFVNKDGEKVTPDYKTAMNFKDNLCIVCSPDTNKFGVIDNTGKTVVDFKFDDMHRQFKDNCLGVCLNGKWGMIDDKGAQVIPFDYQYMTPLNYGLSGVKAMNGKFGFIDRNNNVVVPFEWDDLKVPEENNQRFFFVKKDGKWYCYDRQVGKLAFADGYDDADNFSDGLASVKLNGKYGKINAKGEVVVVLAFDGISDLTNAMLYMNHFGKKKLTETDVLRLKIYTDPSRNSYRITDTIPNEKWDF